MIIQGVTFVSRNLLDLPFKNNRPDNILNWDSFIDVANEYCR